MGDDESDRGCLERNGSQNDNTLLNIMGGD